MAKYEGVLKPVDLTWVEFDSLQSGGVRTHVNAENLGASKGTTGFITPEE